MPRPAPGPVELAGTPVVPGVVVGPAVWAAGAVRLPDDDPPSLAEADRAAERDRLGAAAEVVAARLADRAAAVTGARAALLAATAAMARDRGLLADAGGLVARGVPAAAAVARAAGRFVDAFTAAGGVLAERAADVRDVRDRLVAELTGQPEPGLPVPAVPSVLLADDLAPADAAALDPARVVGLATGRGGPTGHTAVIARELGLPCVVAVPGLAAVPAGTPVLLDGDRGTLTADPAPEEAAARVAAAGAAASPAGCGPAATRDGHRVALLANVQDGAGARAAAAAGAEGIGLLRTELAFLGRAAEPSLDEQAARYADVLAAFPGGSVVLRTLDAGADKPLPFTALPEAANPALGLRGLRTARRDPGLLDRQLDAVAEAARRTGTRPWVMAPMVATVAEAADLAARVRARGLVPGVMVEVPAAALLADRLLGHVDFLSVGTNDLAQYALAADRLSADLADLTDPWQPAVLALVAATADAGARAGKPVGVCGEAAADPLLACVLVGLGVTSLSMAAPAVRAVRARLSAVDLPACRHAAGAARAADDPRAARAAAAAALGG